MTSTVPGSVVTTTDVLRRPWAQARCLRAVDVATVFLDDPERVIALARRRRDGRRAAGGGQARKSP